MENQTALMLAMRYIDSIERGISKRDTLTNHGDNFTGGGEKIALRKYISFISSASYLVVDFIEKGVDT